MAELAAEWARRRPEGMRGLIWYRLPVGNDALNWRWVTLAAVMRGEKPAAKLVVEARKSQTGLIEVDMINEGSGDSDGPVRLEVKAIGGARHPRLVARDALPPFEAQQRGDDTIFEANSIRLAAGERRMAGWIRFSENTEVHLDIQPIRQSRLID
jgi:hypothetical protein